MPLPVSFAVMRTPRSREYQLQPRISNQWQHNFSQSMVGTTVYLVGTVDDLWYWACYGIDSGQHV